MAKIGFVDIGELGWSFYLSAHIRWLKRNTQDNILVMTSPARLCLYEGIADRVMNLPTDYKEKYDRCPSNCFGINSIVSQELIPNETLRKYFERYMVSLGYKLSTDMQFSGRRFFEGKTIYEPYQTKRKGLPIIMIFPRYRKESPFNKRNLPEEFYKELIVKLYGKFGSIIMTIGSRDGSYDIDNAISSNYINYVGRNNDLQDIVNFCATSICAIGSQSALPKLALLQGVPTFMIGHEKERHISEENWMGTMADFYEIDVNGYANINNDDCINKIIKFAELHINRWIAIGKTVN